MGSRYRAGIAGRIGIEGEELAGALTELLPQLEGFDGRGEAHVLVVDLLLDDAGSIGRSGRQARDGQYLSENSPSATSVSANMCRASLSTV